jgi:hypothetical protein
MTEILKIIWSMNHHKTQECCEEMVLPAWVFQHTRLVILRMGCAQPCGSSISSGTSKRFVILIRLLQDMLCSLDRFAMELQHQLSACLVISMRPKLVRECLTTSSEHFWLLLHSWVSSATPNSLNRTVICHQSREKCTTLLVEAYSIWVGLLFKFLIFLL